MQYMLGRLCLCCFLGAAVAYVAPIGGDKRVDTCDFRISFLTQNVQNFNEGETWDLRKRELRTVIASSEADVVGMQALRRLRASNVANQYVDMMNALSVDYPYRTRFVVPGQLSGQGDSVDGLALFSKHRIISTAEVKIDGGSSVQQILIQLNHDPDCRIPPPIVRIFNTQFSSSPEHQQSNLQSTVNFINSFERNSQDVQVLMVDFNSPGANELEALKQLFFVDAWETYSASNEMKSAGLTYPSTAPTERRDRIFVRHTGGKGRGNAAEAKMHLQKVDVKGTRGHTPASDHLGVYAQVTLDYGARAAAADILPPVTEGDPNTVPAPRKDGGFIAKVELTMTNLGHASLSESNMLRNSMATALARKLRVPRSDVFVNLPVMDGSAGTLNLEGGVNDATVVMVANISSEVNTGDFASMMQDIKEKPLPLPGRLGKAQYLDSSARACQVVPGPAGSVPAASLADCCAQCHHESRCEVFAYSEGTCRLFSEGFPGKFDAAVTFGRVLESARDQEPFERRDEPGHVRKKRLTAMEAALAEKHTHVSRRRPVDSEERKEMPRREAPVAGGDESDVLRGQSPTSPPTSWSAWLVAVLLLAVVVAALLWVVKLRKLTSKGKREKIDEWFGDDSGAGFSQNSAPNSWAGGGPQNDGAFRRRSQNDGGFRV